MKLIVGLGNPTKEYEGTRHNTGFICLDYIADKYNASFSLDTSLKCVLARINVDGFKAILMKPMTYMNLSGEAVLAVCNYYKIPLEDIIVISDDLDSHPGRVRLRDSGSAGGHNGLKNIAIHMHSENFKRIKIGIGRSSVIPVVDYVLQKFPESELALINEAKEQAYLAVNDFIHEVDFYKIASKYSKK